MDAFFGNFFLALFLAGLFRFLWTICAMLVRSKDVGNAVFAVALPLSMLYLLIGKILPIESWEGFVAGAVTGGLCCLAWARMRPGNVVP